jgi:hypothetical protein
MPTVMRISGFRFFFYSNENREPKHIHVRSGDAEAKFWLDNVELVWNRGFNERQIHEIETHLYEHLSELIDSWVEFFGEEGND